MSDIHSIYFWLFSLIAVCGGVGLLNARHPISGAISLIAVMLALAGIYGLLAAPFLAIAQILVYAGAIMMLVVFVIMVLNSARDRETPRGSSYGLLGGLLAVLLGVVVLAGVHRSRAALDQYRDKASGQIVEGHHPDAVTGQVGDVGRALFSFSGEHATGWFVLFEVVGLVLLAAMVGAVLLAKRKLSSPEPADEMVTAEGGH